jgi:hypothetical protein
MGGRGVRICKSPRAIGRKGSPRLEEKTGGRRLSGVGKVMKVFVNDEQMLKGLCLARDYFIHGKKREKKG